MYGELIDLVPVRFRAGNPAEQHTFSVLSPRLRCYKAPIRPCVRLVIGSEIVGIEVSDSEYPIIADAICGLAALGKNGRRDTKYLELYKVVELLKGPRTVEQTAVRHYLAHSPQALTRSSTIQTLQRLFGGISINWNGHGHQRIFWTLFGELLITADVTLGKLLTEKSTVIRSKMER